MKTNLIILLLISLFLFSCNKKKYSGPYPLEQFSKQLLPENNTINFISLTGSNSTLELNSETNYFENSQWDTDDNGFGINYYYADFEHLIKNYTSDKFRISYHLYVNMTNAGYWNFLITNIESELSEERINFRVTTEENYESWPSFEYHDLIEFNDTTVYDIYSTEHEGKSYYFQKGKGIVRFEYDNELWIINQ